METKHTPTPCPTCSKLGARVEELFAQLDRCGEDLIEQAQRITTLEAELEECTRALETENNRIELSDGEPSAYLSQRIKQARATLRGTK